MHLHNSSYKYFKTFLPSQIPCDERPLYSALMGYGFLVVFCLALFGNCLNLLIYSSDCIRYYIAIRMLCTKLVSLYNFFFVICTNFDELKSSMPRGVHINAIIYTESVIELVVVHFRQVQCAYGILIYITRVDLLDSP